MATQHGGFTRPQIETFAAGLYHIANSDGISASEITQIKEFLAEYKAEDLGDKLAEIPFDPAEAALTLDTEWLRGVFLRAALYLVRADGKVSDEEKDALRWIASYLKVSSSLEELEAEVAKAQEEQP